MTEEFHFDFPVVASKTTPPVNFALWLPQPYRIAKVQCIYIFSYFVLQMFRTNVPSSVPKSRNSELFGHKFEPVIGLFLNFECEKICKIDGLFNLNENILLYNYQKSFISSFDFIHSVCPMGFILESQDKSSNVG